MGHRLGQKRVPQKRILRQRTESGPQICTVLTRPKGPSGSGQSVAHKIGRAKLVGIAQPSRKATFYYRQRIGEIDTASAVPNEKPGAGKKQGAVQQAPLEYRIPVQERNRERNRDQYRKRLPNENPSAGRKQGAVQRLIQQAPYQKGWSPKKGTIVVGQPASNPAAVVPAPPWCTTAEHRGNSQSCGTLSTKKMLGGTATPGIEPRFPQPLLIIPLMPVSASAW
jgi:hypothetical protein